MSHASMISRRSFLQAFGIFASACAVIVVIGCSDDGLGKRYPVSGKVTYKDQPVAEASIQFYPAGAPGGEKRGATGVVKDGYYTLSTQGGDDGAFPGEYQVSISARMPDMSKAKANQEKTGGSYRQDDVAKAYASAKSAIPRKYESPDLLKATVKAESNKFDFELKD
jgi:hypothetical protein